MFHHPLHPNRPDNACLVNEPSSPSIGDDKRRRGGPGETRGRRGPAKLGSPRRRRHPAECAGLQHDREARASRDHLGVFVRVSRLQNLASFACGSTPKPFQQSTNQNEKVAFNNIR